MRNSDTCQITSFPHGHSAQMQQSDVHQISSNVTSDLLWIQVHVLNVKWNWWVWMTNPGFSQSREWKLLCKYYEQEDDKGKRPLIIFAKEIPSVFPPFVPHCFNNSRWSLFLKVHFKILKFFNPLFLEEKIVSAWSLYFDLYFYQLLEPFKAFPLALVTLNLYYPVENNSNYAWQQSTRWVLLNFIVQNQQCMAFLRIKKKSKQN